MPTKTEKDAGPAHTTTGHSWDGIQEYDLPLPRWWLYVFYVTIGIAVLYFVLYPSIPWFTGYFEGVLGRQERVVLESRLEDARGAQSGMFQAMADTPLEEIVDDPDLLSFALVGGRAAFADNCAPCHGLGGAGQDGGYPVLADDDWLWGGTLADIHTTIAYGVRHDPIETRFSQMPAFGDMPNFDRDTINDVTAHVLALAELEHDEEAAARGAETFAQQCAACHGANGEGLQSLGAPRLADRIWLFEGTPAAIAAQIENPQHGVMPAWVDRLDPGTINMLTVYVHSLGGGM